MRKENSLTDESSVEVESRRGCKEIVRVSVGCERDGIQLPLPLKVKCNQTHRTGRKGTRRSLDRLREGYFKPGKGEKVERDGKRRS
jgi:hypothetical protein